MINKYFNVTVKPEISVAALAAGNIADTEIMSDWHGFDVPKGANRLIGMTILYTGKNGVDYAPTDFEIFWGKANADGTAPPTLGPEGALVVSHGWFPNIIGKSYVDASDFKNDGDLIMGNVLVPNTHGGSNTTAGTSNMGYPNSQIVLEGVPNSGSNVGYDKLYIAVIAKDTHNWGPSTMTVDGTMVTTSPTLTVADLSPILSGVGPGDVLRDEDNNLLGTVKTVDSATQITMEDNLASASADDKLVYNTSPITFILSFER